MFSTEMSPECRTVVVIPCLNEEKLIARSLESVSAARGVLAVSEVVEIVYVDNGSEDDTVKFIQEFADEHAGISVIHQPRRGTGHARRLGATSALSRAVLRPRANYEDFWIISTDADVTAPESWLADWLRNFDGPSSLLIAGAGNFPAELNHKYPNVSQVLAELRVLKQQIADIFGPINLDGTNSAIERKAYAAAGPFEQPFRTTLDGKVENIFGEDWDVGTRARYLGMPVGLNKFNPVTVSARRFEHDMEGFFNGTTYAEEFVRVNAPPDQSDITPSDIASAVAVSIRRQSMYYVSKSILVDNGLLEQYKVGSVLGHDLVESMKAWIIDTPRPNLLNDRNSFMLEYLVAFHERFGEEITECLLRNNARQIVS